MKDDTRVIIEGFLRQIVAEKGVNRNVFGLEESLYEDGIGMDSLDAATFSVMLEHHFGADPYAGDRFPRTLGDVLVFYNVSSYEREQS